MSDTFAAPSLPPGRTLDLPGRGRTFIREVAGPPGAPTLLLLHGLGATADLNWFTAYSALGRLFHVVAMDHRGHGRGIRSRTRFRLADCADDAAAVCDALGISSVVAVGYSMGGPISQLLWRRHRDVHMRLMLLGTLGGLMWPAITRMPVIAGRFGLMLGLFAALALAPAVRDTIVRARMRWLSVGVGAAILISFLLRPAIGNSVAWRTAAAWLVG